MQLVDIEEYDELELDSLVTEAKPASSKNLVKAPEPSHTHWPQINQERCHPDHAKIVEAFIIMIETALLGKSWEAM